MITPLQIRSQIRDYLSNRVSGIDFVKCIDDAVSSDDVYEYDKELQNLILKYQDLLALYVDDPTKRLKHSAYYGPENLRTLAEELGRKLDAFDLGSDEERAR